MNRRLLLLLLFVLGCQPTPKDVAKWVATPDGPAKLAHVVRDPKAPIALRGQALASLSEVRSHGRNVGVDLALDALDGAPARTAVVAAIASEITRRIDEAPSKDLAYGLLAHGHAEGAANSELRAALMTWTTTRTEERLDGHDQRFSPRAAFTLLGADAARPLVEQFAGGARPELVAAIVMEAGDDATKRAASGALVAAVESIDAPAWMDKQRPLVEAANEKAGARTSREQVDGQLALLRERELTSRIEAMRLVGGPPAFGWLVEVVASPARAAPLRAAALSVLLPRAAEIDAASRDRLAAGLVAQPAPFPSLGGVPPIFEAAQLLAAIPAERPRLASLLSDSKWFVRRDAGAALIQSSTSLEDLDATLAKLYPAPTEAEIDGYAIVVPRVEGGVARMRQHLDDESLASKLVALKSLATSDHALVQRSSHDATRLPVPWICLAATATTVGEVVEHCYLSVSQHGAPQEGAKKK